MPASRPRIDRLRLSPAARSDLNGELRKLAGADPEQLSSLSASQRRQAREAVDDSFVAAFRMVMLSSAALAVAAAAFGAAIGSPTRARNQPV